MNFASMRVAFCAGILASLAAAVPLRAQQAASDSAHFETAAIHVSQVRDGCFSMSPPGSNHFVMTCIPLRALVQLAFVPDELEGPDKALDTAYDIQAALPDAKPWTMDTVKPMLQALLVERFRLTFHKQTRSVAGYALVVTARGSRMTPAPEDSAVQHGGVSMNYVAQGRVQGRGISAGAIAELLGLAVHKHIEDKTGLTGTYDLDLKYAPETSADSDLPEFSTAVKEQLGLELKPARVPIQVMVVDHVDATPLSN